MKKKRKRNLMIILTILILPALIFKAYLTIGNINYEFEKAKLEADLSFPIKDKLEITKKTLKRNGYDIHYQVAGSRNKELIVFIHPAFSDHRAFLEQIEYFSKNYFVITVDLIGHGLSKANGSKDKIDISEQHILEIMKLEQKEEAHLVGVSMGSLIAQYFAYKNPSKTKSLTALGGYNIHEVNPEVQKAQQSANMGLIFKALFSMKAFRRNTAEITCSTKKGQAIFYESSSHYERKSFLSMEGLQNVIKDRKNLSITYPTLILVGENDIELAHRMSKSWHDGLEKSELTIINNAGHCANIDQPGKFNELLEKFINKL